MSSPTTTNTNTDGEGGAKAPFDKRHYYANPGEYRSVFAEKVLPFASVLVHCMYWDRRFPRLVTTQEFRALDASGKSRLLGLCDVSCDEAGAVEFMTKFSSIEHPFYVYDVRRNHGRHRNRNTIGPLFFKVSGGRRMEALRTN